jgi:virginiamycin B lyase
VVASVVAWAAIIPHTLEASAAPKVTEFSSGLHSGNRPVGLAVGADGNLWATVQGAVPAIARVTPAGVIQEFSSGLQADNASVPVDLARGADGNVWFTDQGPVPSIGRITSDGTITEFSAGLQDGGRSCPGAIASGPDGNVWFADEGSDCGSGAGLNEIGKVTPSGTITEYAQGLQERNLSKPTALTSGPDGKVWFTDAGTQHLGASAIGQVSSAGEITEMPLDAKSIPFDVVRGPGDRMWFTDRGGTAAIARVESSAAPTEFSDGLQIANQSSPGALAVGSDGDIWFADGGAVPEIGKISTAGAIEEFGLEGDQAPGDLMSGPDGNIWFTDTGPTPAIGRLALQVPPAVVTGGVTDLTAGRATVAGAVNPQGGAVSSIAVEYGPTESYGTAVFARPASLPAGGLAVPVSAKLVGLPAGTLLHYRVVAANAFGAAAGVDRTITTPLAPAAHAPVLGQVSQSNSVWRRGAHPVATTVAHRTAVSRTPVGTTFKIGVDQLAVVDVVFTKIMKRANGATRRVRRGEVSFLAHGGLNKLRFGGRLADSSMLAPGRYSVAITATVSGARSKTKRLGFTIVEG